MNMLPYYLHLFSKLRRDLKNGGAPHKPILLLAILELVRKGDIVTNRIEITPELVLEFKTIWGKLVITQHIPNFALPFYHMRSEPFWRLVENPYRNIPITKSNSITSLKGLRESVAFAEIDKELLSLILDPASRTILTESLLDQYFQETKTRFYSTDYDLFNQLELQMHEDRIIYQERIQTLKETLDKEEFEEEIFIRGGVFKREIPKIYDYQCAISGMRIEALSSAQMVDACHIKPFALSKDDTISNGISLSPNLHRAFDRGLLTVTTEYIVRVSTSITESESPFSLKQFEGKIIHLPSDPRNHPSAENLSWHNTETYRL